MIKINDAKPVYNGVFVTSERFKEDQIENGLIVYYKGEINPFQKVFRVGPFVKNIKEGDYVKINFARYTKYKYGEDDIHSELPVKNEKRVFIPEVRIGGESYFHIEENDIVMVVTDWEETENIPVIAPTIIITGPNAMVN